MAAAAPDPGPTPCDLPAWFAARMAALGPWEDRPRVAVAVSGGPDSMALLLLALSWAHHATALIVDHGLRPEAAAEAAETAAAVRRHGAAARVITLAAPPSAAGARAVRLAALGQAAVEANCLHLLLAHHRGDQAETVLMRAGRGSFAPGLGGIAPVRFLDQYRLIRPLLGVPPAVLLSWLRARGVAAVRDAANRDLATGRGALRAVRLDAGGTGAATAALALAADRRRRACVAPGPPVTLRPEGFAIIGAAPLPPSVLGQLIATIAGAERIGSAPASLPAVLGGVRICRAPRVAGAGWIVVREEAAVAPPIPALADALWDRRFALAAAAPSGTMLGALGRDAAAARAFGLLHLPAPARRVLPALRDAGGRLLAVAGASTGAALPVLFMPALPFGAAATALSAP